jgi:hypothetical protein
MDIRPAIHFNARRSHEAGLMKKLVLLLVLASVPAWPQAAVAKETSRQAGKRADDCAPIGRTADGTLVYSMKCENLPAPPPPPQAEVKEAPAAEPETQRSGLFGWSFDRRAKE